MQSLCVEFETFKSPQNPWKFVCSQDDAYVYVTERDRTTGRDTKSRESLSDRLTQLLEGKTKNWRPGDHWWFFGWRPDKIQVFREQVFIFQILDCVTPRTQPTFRALRDSLIICARNLKTSCGRSKFLCVLTEKRVLLK